MKVYYDFNADAGGYVTKDKLWWYGSYREFDTEVSEPRFPVKPSQTKLRHFSGKTTYSLPANNKIIGSFMRTLKIQPNRLDATRITSPINETEGSTQSQRHWAWVYKGEWNKVLSDSLFTEVRADNSATTGRSCPTRTLPGRASRISRPARSPGRTSIASRIGAATRSWDRSATSRMVSAAATTSSSAAKSSTRRSSRSSSRRRMATRRFHTSGTAWRRKSSCSTPAQSKRR